MKKFIFLSIGLLVNITSVASDKTFTATAHVAAATKISGQQTQPVRRGSVYFDLGARRKRKDDEMTQRYHERLQNLNHFSPDEPREFPKSYYLGIKR
jgi:hypothetical protein